jgi:undecaprenyl-diphosphatase
MALGLIQGLTEFLPVSSSGHLALALPVARALGLEVGAIQQDVAFDLLLHLATMTVVLGAFWKHLLHFWRNERIVLGYLAVGSIPTAAAGLLFEGEFEAIRRSPLAVSAALLVTAAGLLLADRITTPTLRLPRLGVAGSLVVGLCQALAIVPGISRSGATLTGGIVRGLSRDDAVVFSFLLFLPAVAGASLLKGLKEPEAFLALRLGPSLAAFAVAVASGYAALRLLLRVVRTRRLSLFAYYCIALALAGGVLFGRAGRGG